MKFHHLPLGARFRFRDEVFRKSSPILAQTNAGLSRAIPRSAQVEPLDGSPWTSADDHALAELGRAIEELGSIAEAAVGADERRQESVRMALARSRNLLESLHKQRGIP